jgi:ABC-type multidrug transport system fused ATPase/permease subunit
MFQAMRKNSLLISLSITLLAIAAYCQLLMPSYIADGLSSIISGEHNFTYVLAFSVAFLCKNAMQSLGSCLASYIESDTRFFLIHVIMQNADAKNVAKKTTLIKEDAERVASAVSEIIHLAGSCILTVSTAYILINQNIYFLAPIIVIAIFTTRHIRSSAEKVQECYKAEIKKEELYKASILNIFNMSTLKQSSIDASLAENAIHLDEATYARYHYNKMTLIVSFWPEIIIAASTAFIILLSATFSNELFGVQLIAYLGYIGIFSMASASTVRMALSLIGINVSVKRIFENATNE